MIKSLAVFLSFVCASFGATINTGGSGGGVGDVTAAGNNAFTGNNSFTGSSIRPANVLAAFAINVAKASNEKTISADQTFTFTGSPTTGQGFPLKLANSDTAPHVATIPSSWSVIRQATITSFVVPASYKGEMFWVYDGSIYLLYGEPQALDNLSGTAAPTVNDDTADGYAAGSWWLDTTAHKLYQAESVALGAAVWIQIDGRGSESGVHATPTTTNPLSPTWTSIMHTVWYGATGTINLPAAAGYNGRSILIYNTGAFTVTIDPNGSEVVVRDGTVQTGGVNFTLSSGAGNYVGLISDGARWITLGYKGTLTVGS